MVRYCYSNHVIFFFNSMEVREIRVGQSAATRLQFGMASLLSRLSYCTRTVAVLELKVISANRYRSSVNSGLGM